MDLPAILIMPKIFQSALLHEMLKVGRIIQEDLQELLSVQELSKTATQQVMLKGMP